MQVVIEKVNLERALMTDLASVEKWDVEWCPTRYKFIFQSCFKAGKQFERIDNILCPALVLKPNVKSLVCNSGSVCKMICDAGSSPVGKRRITCRKGKTESVWSDELGECKQCENPTVLLLAVMLSNPRNGP